MAGITKDNWHEISHVGIEEGKAICSKCGIVNVQVQGNRIRCGNRATEYNRQKKLRQRYGLTVEQAQAITDRHGGMCEACRYRPGRFIDHDHATGVVRGFLCPGCNTALGALGDSAERIEALGRYLSRAK